MLSPAISAAVDSLSDYGNWELVTHTRQWHTLSLPPSNEFLIDVADALGYSATCLMSPMTWCNKEQTAIVRYNVTRQESQCEDVMIRRGFFTFRTSSKSFYSFDFSPKYRFTFQHQLYPQQSDSRICSMIKLKLNFRQRDKSCKFLGCICFESSFINQ